MNDIDFHAAFAVLTDNPPFPWQCALFKRFIAGDFPYSCNLPTGLGKTSAIHVWLLALAAEPVKVPRRLVYVVNRRTVVDQSTDEARRLRERLPRLPNVVARLRQLCAISNESELPLAISTLRGQFADNGEWSLDPARPAVIAGTVDMIGSRLLFSGYGCGVKRRPLHAGFLGQDTLLVHDEAHLEPAFQKLIEAVRDEQRREPAPLGEGRRLRVMELTATSRAQGPPSFGLTTADYENTVVKQRLFAKKGIAFHSVQDERETPARVAELALKYQDSGQAILVFLASLTSVRRVEEQLRKEFTSNGEPRVQLLTGTLRGYERDRLPNDPVFARFLPPSTRPPGVGVREGTVYLICTSAGEVGVNISADHLVCDLTTFDSMAQRLGRVNRFGDGNAKIDVVHPAAFETEDDPREAARERTLVLLNKLPKRTDTRREASPHALGKLSAAERQAAFSPQPIILSATDILFDAWALTSIREPLPGRPPVEPYLHGVSEWEPPETHVAWRDDVELLRDSGLTDKELAELLGDYPLKPHELLRERSERVHEHLADLAKEHAGKPVWLVHADGRLETLMLNDLVEDEERITNRTVVLPPTVGGLTQAGMLGHGDPPPLLDVADEWFGELDGAQLQLRLRTTTNAAISFPAPAGMRRVAVVPLNALTNDDGAELDDDDEATRKVRLFFVRPRVADDDGSKSARRRLFLDTHHNDAERTAVRLGQRLLPEELQPVLAMAAKFHDLGKNRNVWQRSIGNPDLTKPLAKSGSRGPLLDLSGYRHEFGSLIELGTMAEFISLSEHERDLLLHLIAAHHGSARPHFTAEAADPERPDGDCRTILDEVPRRFARLQRQYGRWGLAYLESLLRAADAYASANPTEDTQ